MSGHLEGRVVVVTGAGSGFGRLLVRGCVERGARAVAIDVNADAAAETVNGLDGQAIAVTADVTSLEQMRAAIATAVDTFGGVDVMINNAGVMPLAFWSDHEAAADAWSRCIDINIKGVVNGISAVYDHMIERGRGHVVNISSIYGNHAVPGSGVYTATKAAVALLSDTLRQEAQGRIKVTTVRPTGVAGTNLGSGIVNVEAVSGIAGVNRDAYFGAITAWGQGTLSEAQTDRDDVGYWLITPEDLVEQVLYAVDQPWGISIAEITVRASGEHFVL